MAERSAANGRREQKETKGKKKLKDKQRGQKEEGQERQRANRPKGAKPKGAKKPKEAKPQRQKAEAIKITPLINIRHDKKLAHVHGEGWMRAGANKEAKRRQGKNRG